MEALAHEREERAGDDDLERLCSEGHAASSQRMRATCLQMRRARATPILIKACLRAVSSAYAEFSERLFTWQSWLSVVLFVFMCVASPLSKLLWLLLPSQPTVFASDEEDSECRLVVITQDDIGKMPRRKQLWQNMRLRFGNHPALQTTDENSYYGDARLFSDDADRARGKKID